MGARMPPMLDERRDLLWSLVRHLLAATPFLAMTWHLFARTAGDPDGGDQRMLRLGCAVAAAIIVARPIAALVAEPTGSLFFPRARARPEPGYSLADTQRKREHFERAMAEYEHIVAAFPGELRAHIAMIEIALVNLRDADRARTCVTRSLAVVPDEPMRMELLRVYRALSSRAADDDA